MSRLCLSFMRSRTLLFITIIMVVSTRNLECVRVRQDAHAGTIRSAAHQPLRLRGGVGRMKVLHRGTRQTRQTERHEESLAQAVADILSEPMGSANTKLAAPTFQPAAAKEHERPIEMNQPLAVRGRGGRGTARGRGRSSTVASRSRTQSKLSTDENQPAVRGGRKRGRGGSVLPEAKRSAVERAFSTEAKDQEDQVPGRRVTRQSARLSETGAVARMRQQIDNCELQSKVVEVIKSGETSQLGGGEAAQRDELSDDSLESVEVMQSQAEAEDLHIQDAGAPSPASRTTREHTPQATDGAKANDAALSDCTSSDPPNAPDEAAAETVGSLNRLLAPVVVHVQSAPSVDEAQWSVEVGASPAEATIEHVGSAGQRSRASESPTVVVCSPPRRKSQPRARDLADAAVVPHATQGQDPAAESRGVARLIAAREHAAATGAGEPAWQWHGDEGVVSSPEGSELSKRGGGQPSLTTSSGSTWWQRSPMAEGPWASTPTRADSNGASSPLSLPDLLTSPLARPARYSDDEEGGGRRALEDAGEDSWMEAEGDGREHDRGGEKLGEEPVRVEEEEERRNREGESGGAGGWFEEGERLRMRKEAERAQDAEDAAEQARRAAAEEQERRLVQELEEVRRRLEEGARREETEREREAQAERARSRERTEEQERAWQLQEAREREELERLRRVQEERERERREQDERLREEQARRQEDERQRQELQERQKREEEQRMREEAERRARRGEEEMMWEALSLVRAAAAAGELERCVEGLEEVGRRLAALGGEEAVPGAAERLRQARTEVEAAGEKERAKRVAMAEVERARRMRTQGKLKEAVGSLRVAEEAARRVDAADVVGEVQGELRRVRRAQGQALREEAEARVEAVERLVGDLKRCAVLATAGEMLARPPVIAPKTTRR